MILVDTSVWAQHFRALDNALVRLLELGQVLAHPFVIGELALGNLHPRALVLTMLRSLPQAGVATDGEVMQFIDREALYGIGIGYVDAHLLASVRLTPGSGLWTRDKRLHRVADNLQLAWDARPDS